MTVSHPKHIELKNKINFTCLVKSKSNKTHLEALNNNLEINCNKASISKGNKKSIKSPIIRKRKKEGLKKVSNYLKSFRRMSAI